MVNLPESLLKKGMIVRALNTIRYPGGKSIITKGKNYTLESQDGLVFMSDHSEYYYYGAFEKDFELDIKATKLVGFDY